MADTFDPYREALVVEIDTKWPPSAAELPPGEKARLEQRLHADPGACGNLEYVRTHTGFCRTITATDADVARVRA